MKELTVSANEGGQRLDKYLSKRFKTMPKSLLYKYLRTKCIKLNGKKASPEVFVNEGDKLTFYINEEFFAEENTQREFDGVSTELRIVYEDENILIADKPAGLLCHSDSKESTDTLVNRIKAYLVKNGEYKPGGAFAPALCNRIDRNTCGLVIAAKTAAALRDVNRRIKQRLVERRYLAAVHGTPSPQSGCIKGYLRKNTSENKVYLDENKRFPDEKEAITKYTTLRSKNGISLVEAELVTGRTHQIRVQLASIGNPLLNDTKYENAGREKDIRDKKIRRQYHCRQSLCAYKLKFLETEKDSISYLDGKVFLSSAPDFTKYFDFTI